MKPIIVELVEEIYHFFVNKGWTEEREPGKKRNELIDYEFEMYNSGAESIIISINRTLLENYQITYGFIKYSRNSFRVYQQFLDYSLCEILFYEFDKLKELDVVIRLVGRPKNSEENSFSMSRYNYRQFDEENQKKYRQRIKELRDYYKNPF